MKSVKDAMRHAPNGFFRDDDVATLHIGDRIIVSRFSWMT
jgi:hypothetical protein